MVVCCLSGLLFPVLPEGGCDKAGLAAQSKCQQHHHCYHEGELVQLLMNEVKLRPHLQSSQEHSGWVWVGMGTCPSCIHGGLENPAWQQFLTLPSPACKADACWTVTGKLTKR